MAKQSHFSLKKNSPRGLKKNNMTLVKLEGGGYKNMKPHHERVVKLEELLEKYENIKDSRDLYDDEHRQKFKPTITYEHFLEKEE